MKGKEVVEDIGVYVYDEEEWLKDHDDCLPEKYLLKFDEARALLIHFAALEAVAEAVKAMVRDEGEGAVSFATLKALSTLNENTQGDE